MLKRDNRLDQVGFQRRFEQGDARGRGAGAPLSFSPSAQPFSARVAPAGSFAFVRSAMSFKTSSTN
jgi:hypothetical protein